MGQAVLRMNPTAPHLYRGYGLTIASMFPLPGALPGGTGPSDLAVVAGPARLAGEAIQSGPYRHSGKALELEIADVGRFVLTDPNRLEVAATPGCDPHVLGAYIIASGLPMLLWRRGGVLFHAAGLALPGRAVVALAGASGVGKSTLSQALLELGACLIGDDTLWLPTPDSREICGLSGGQFHRTALGEPVFHALPGSRQSDPAPLDVLVVLDRSGKVPGLQKLAGLDALQALLAVRHRPRVAALLGREPDVLAACAKLAALLPVYRLTMQEGQVAASAALLMALADELRH